MQTFLPLPDFAESAHCLDRQRLGKQRVEGLQILKACVYRSAWGNHPAVLMWKGHERALNCYVQSICNEWIRRGYKDTLADKVMTFCSDEGIFNEELIMPSWFGNEDFHLSHKTNLIRKLPGHYGPMWPDVPADLPYVWPVRRKTMDITHEVKHQRAMRELRGAFETFIRTGVWGTCVDCPFVDGKKIPELCDNAERYDHQLTPESLFEQYRMQMK